MGDYGLAVAGGREEGAWTATAENDQRSISEPVGVVVHVPALEHEVACAGRGGQLVPGLLVVGRVGTGDQPGARRRRTAHGRSMTGYSR